MLIYYTIAFIWVLAALVTFLVYKSENNLKNSAMSFLELCIAIPLFILFGPLFLILGLFKKNKPPEVSSISFPKIPSLIDTKEDSLMSSSQFDDLLYFLILENSFEDKNECKYKMHDNIKLHGSIMLDILNKYKTPITFPCAEFLLQYYKNTIDIIVWCYTLNRIFNKNRRIVKLNDLCDQFPDGFPSKNAIDKVWQAQKGNNYVDTNGKKLKIGDLLDQKEIWELDPTSN